MPPPFLKIYRIKPINVWPYEDTLSVKVVDASSPVLLETGMSEEITRRCYLSHPGEYVNLSLVEPYAFGWEGEDDGREISPYRLLPGGPLRLQFEYVLFRSYRAQDYALVEPVIDLVKEGGLEALRFPPDLRPDRALLAGDAESDPAWAWHNELKPPPDRPVTTFLISERSDIPFINDHTVPEHVDHQFVYAAVTAYGLFEAPPTYREALETLQRYCVWFDSVLERA